MASASSESAARADRSADHYRSLRDAAATARREREELGLLTLNTLLRSVGQVPITVELRDDTELVGLLEESDAYMNISISGVTRRPSDGGPAMQTTETVYVKGTSIRCVHLPPDINAEHLVRSRIKAVDQGARSFTQRKTKVATERPSGLTPIVGSVVSEADADLGW